MKCTVIFNTMNQIFTLALACYLCLTSPPSLAQVWKYTPLQKEFIAHLSGYSSSTAQPKLKARSSSTERAQARRYLIARIEELGLEAKRQAYVQPNIHPLIDLFFDPFQGANVYTILPATQKSEEYVLIGAHFDTELNCPGAIDNGSGLALIYTVLHQMRSLQVRKRNLIVTFFDQEEEHLNGSRAFAQFLKDEKLKIHSVHTFDTIGWDGDGDKAVELESPSPALDTLYRRVAKQMNIPVYTTKVNASDHEAFRDYGFNAMGITDEYAGGDFAPYKDTPQDTYDTVNFDFLATSTQLVYEVIKTLISHENDAP